MSSRPNLARNRSSTLPPTSAEAKSEGTTPRPMPNHANSESTRRVTHPGEIYPGIYDEMALDESMDQLDEAVGPLPVQNPAGRRLYRQTSLEHERAADQQRAGFHNRRNTLSTLSEKIQNPKRILFEISTIGYLIVFSIFGTLGRLGLQAITFYPGAPVVFGVIWCNFAGSLILGFLVEDRMLFRHICPTHKQFTTATKDNQHMVERRRDIDYVGARKAHNAAKKVTPLYIGLATGFCGSFTSFSSFIRDAYLALSNRLPMPVNHTYNSSDGDNINEAVSRNGGYSFMAVLAVLILTVSLSIGGLIFGAHLAIGVEKFTPRISKSATERIMNHLAMPLALALWLGAIFLTIFPPEHYWRGRATFSLVFAPLGVLTRFYISLFLNSKFVTFPLGTFTANIFGTAVLGMCWDLQHVPVGGVVGCQVLQGIMDGYCGCVTTVSTWVDELVGLRRYHAYRYGLISVLVALAILVVIMGGLQWTRGFSEIACEI